MSRILWIAKVTVVSLAGITLISSMANGESRPKNQNEAQAQPPSLNVDQTNESQTQQEILDYWTPERMRNAQPIMPTVPDSSGEQVWTPERMRNAQPITPTVPEDGASGEAKPPQVEGIKPAPSIHDADTRSEDYWTPERIRNAKPITPTVPDQQNSD